MSVKSQVQAAEEALRQALINALAEGDEDCLSELFTQYQAISNLNKKVNDLSHFAYDSNYNFNLSSDYLNRPGGDMDALDNVIDFGGNITIGNSSSSDDTITFS